jgi:hypothetical protein
MKRSDSWRDNPLYVGSIYIKPTNEKITTINKCFQYMYYYMCCRYLCD